jgi:hypothetical protein
MRKIVIGSILSLLLASPSFASSTTTSTSGSESVGAASIIQNSTGASGVNYSGGYTVRNTPDLGGLTAIPSANCMGVDGIGLVGPGGGLQLLGSRRDSVCTWEGKVNMAVHTGQPQVGLVMWCINDPDYRKAREILNEPCPIASYPKGQQAKLLEQIAKVQTPAPQPKQTVIIEIVPVPMSINKKVTADDLNREMLQDIKNSKQHNE